MYAGVWKFGKLGRSVRYDSDVGISVPVPAIVSRAEWDAVQDALVHRKTARRARVPVEQDEYLLRGKLYCGHSGGMLRTTPNHGTRYYGCRLHRKQLADMQGAEQCDLPDVYATHLEAELWQALTDTLLDQDFLDVGIKDARNRHHEMNRVRNDRLKAIDAEIARDRKRLDGIMLRLIDGDDNPESIASLERTQREVASHLERLTAERGQLEETHSEGLTQEDANVVATFAREMRAGMEHATDVDKRKLYDLLNVRGTVFLDENGIKLGRKHHYRIEWDAAISLLHTSSRFRNPVMQ